MSKTWKDVETSLRKYHEEFRRPGLPELDISGIYVLTPPEEAGAPLHIAGKWPDQYPNSEKRGVYIVFGEGYKLLYVGKASAKGCMHERLGKYFQYNNRKDKFFRIVAPGKRSGLRSWTSPPKYVVTIAVPDMMSFEAPALEEYLIPLLQPPDNINARGRLESPVS